MNEVLVDQKLPASVDPKAQAEAVSRALRRAAHKARTPPSIISGGSGFRARKGDRAFRLGIIASFVAFVLGPTLVASVYWGLVASKQYSTEAKFALRTGESSALDSLGSIVGVAGSQQAQDAQIVTNFIRSRAIVELLDKTIDLRSIYSRGDVDYFSRFDRLDPIEDLEKYWRKRVDASIDAMSGIISVNVRAFTPDESLALTTKIVELSERLVNELSTRSRRAALEQARSELARAERRLEATTAAMRNARDAQGVVDAKAAAEALDKLITTLRLELSHAEESLATQAGAQDAPQVRILNARIQSLKNQIAEYSAQIAGEKSAGGDSMAKRLGALSRQQTELDLARQQYAFAAAAFESARVDIETQHAYLVSFLRPTLAEKSTYPRRWWEWSIIVAPSVLGWAVMAAIAFLVRDHMAK